MVKLVAYNEIFDQVEQEIGVSPWFLIDQQRINEFAEVTEDRQFIHVDPKAAAQTPFGTTIAHGYLTLSLLSHLLSNILIAPKGMQMAINYGFEKIRFLNPVKVDSEVRARVILKSAEEKKVGQLKLNLDVTVEIKGEEKPALLAEWISMLIYKPN